MALLAASLCGLDARAAPLDNHSCGWLFRLSGDQVNAAFPDAAARYWIAAVPIPPGYHLDLSGNFPHARYISFITYDFASRAIDGIADYQIVPQPRSVNPFVPGANRNARRRAYVVHVRNEQLPATRAQNSIYTENQDKPVPKTTRPARTALVIYRVYEPDERYAVAEDITGGVGLPSMKLVSDDNTKPAVAIPSCHDTSLPDLQLTQRLANAPGGSNTDGLPQSGLGGHNPPQWLRYTNAANGLASNLLNNDTPTGTTAWPPAQQATNMLPSGGFYENIHNAYVFTGYSQAFGDVLVIRGKAPTTPSTYPNTPTMGTGQLRYWSFCTNAATTQFLACAQDDQIPTDSSGFYTIVVSSSNNRPANATESCGVKWLAKGPAPQSVLILRNMLPATDFAQAIQNAKQGSEQTTMGDFYPQGKYFDHAASFAALGCPVDTSRLPYPGQ